VLHVLHVFSVCVLCKIVPPPNAYISRNVDALGACGQSQWGFHEVSWVLNMLTWYRINEERDDKSFMGVESNSWG
jgi:hypothetical protein